jgi:hypothetical protein
VDAAPRGGDGKIVLVGAGQGQARPLGRVCGCEHRV